MSHNGLMSLADLVSTPIRLRPRLRAKFRVRCVVEYLCLDHKLTRYTFECGHVVETEADIGAKGRCVACVGT